MNSCIKNNSKLKSTLKILHGVKQLKEDITPDDAAQKEKTKGKSKEKKKNFGQRHMVNITINCQIYSLETESFFQISQNESSKI